MRVDQDRMSLAGKTLGFFKGRVDFFAGFNEDAATAEALATIW